MENIFFWKRVEEEGGRVKRDGAGVLVVVNMVGVFYTHVQK
jgi:hypothetical protein